jgi:hypothetical protein
MLKGGNLIPEADRLFLEEKYSEAECLTANGQIHIIIHQFNIPAEHYVPSTVSLLLQLPSGYPNAAPDMFWTNPRVTLLNGDIPTRTDVTEPHHNKEWQRWSRHNISKWRPGVDGLRSFISSIRRELQKGV